MVWAYKEKCRYALLRRCERLATVGNMRGRGRPKKYLGEVIRQDMSIWHILSLPKT